MRWEELCEFAVEPRGDAFSSVCLNCGYSIQEKTGNVRRRCLGPCKPLLGNVLANLLAKCGITEKRYLAVKKALRMRAKCGCDQRRRRLNRYHLLIRRHGWRMGSRMVRVEMAENRRRKKKRKKCPVHGQ